MKYDDIIGAFTNDDDYIEEDEVQKSNEDKTIFFTKVNNVVNKDIDKWIRPWELEKFDDLYNRDERFFAILVKGLLSWLNRNIVLYNKSINHFIFNTGSSYMYVESNGYEYVWCETTGEDQIYMHMPRCLVELGSIDILLEELSQPFSRGNYERKSGNLINGYNAEIKRIPISMDVTLKYTLANFNESIILVQELIDSLVFQKYFSISYLGQTIQCSIEFSANFNIQLNQIDMESKETNKKIIELPLKIETNYPIINTRSEIKTDKIISEFNHIVQNYKGDPDENTSVKLDQDKNTIY